MKILTLNCGSSSLKYTFYDTDAARALADGAIERITIGDSFIVHRLAPSADGSRPAKSLRRDCRCPTHKEAIDLVLATLTGEEAGPIGDPGEISAVAHRVVHGGEELTRSVIIDDDVLRIIRRYIDLAPLHNPPNVAGIEAARALLPDAPQVAVFDTAFHYTIPDYAYIYALPYEWYHDLGVRRYGFHGTSHLYVSRRAAALLGKKPSEVNLVTLHLGNGASACAVLGGRSVDTSMGLTPLEGLVMGTRSGDIDPAIPFQLPRSIPLALPEIYMLLNRRSGVLGLTGKYADRRDVLAHMGAAAASDDAGAEDPGSPYRCKLALEVECYRLKKYVGAYAAALGRVDAVVFTAGVGENAAPVRELSLRGLESLGIVLDEEINRNAPAGQEVDVSDGGSRVKIFVIPTDEERVFIEDTVALLDGTYDLPDRFEYAFQRPDYEPRIR
jgi:acetate kinase